MNTIRSRREQLDLTLEELATKLGVHFTTVAQWEKELKSPNNKHRTKLAQALNCTIYDLFPDLIQEHEPSHEDVSKSLLPPSPFAKFSGTLKLGDSEIDCYVLDTEERVISLKAIIRAIAGTKTGDLREYLVVKPLQDVIDADEVLSHTIEFYVPNSGLQLIARGIKAETFLQICDAYVYALEKDLLATDRQKEMAVKCSMILRSCAKVGLIALVDEATGYQYERAQDALQLKLRAFILEEMRAWEKTFPDELWEQFGRLTNWKQPLNLRPKWWGKLVMELVYDALDPDIANHLRTHKPPPQHGQNYHQWLSENIGLKALITHIYQIIGIAKTCADLQELRYKVALHYGKKPVNLMLYLPSDNR